MQNISNIIRQMRHNGAKVNVERRRPTEDNRSQQCIVRIAPSGFASVHGVSTCSKADQFVKSKGLQIAFRRAMKNLNTVIGRGGVKRLVS